MTKHAFAACCGPGVSGLLLWLVLPWAAAAQDATGLALSRTEARLADCVGAVLALESLWRSELMDHPDAATQAHTTAERADALLRVALVRHVGLGHVQAFRQRSAGALAAARVRFAIIAPMLADPADAARDLDRQSSEDCAPFQPP